MLTVEQLVALRKAIESSGDRDAMLQDAAVPLEEWLATQRHWLGALATQLGSGDTSLAERYRAALFESADSTPPGQTTDETQLVPVWSDRPAASKDALPFRGTSESLPSALGADPPVHPQAGETSFLPRLDILEATTPFEEAAAPLELRIYAELLAASERIAEDQREALRRRYGISSDAEWRKIEQQMGRFLRRNGVARAKFEALLASIRSDSRS
jgi:hypothetical protein